MNQHTQIRRGTIPRLAMMNDLSGFGRCSTTVSLPVLSALGIQVCPIPTAILSNHLGFPSCYMDDYTPHIGEYLAAWEKLSLHFDGFYCGFFGNTEQIAIAEEFLARFQPSFFLLDPVMGDHGRLYSSVSEKHCEGLKKLAAEADVLTPNLTETFLLSGMPYCEAPSKELLTLLLQKLQVLCPSGKIVITGITGEKGITNLIFENGLATPCTLPYAGASRPGTGDIFASVLAGELMKQKALPLSVAKAADFVARCIENSELCATPIQEGVCLENCLPLLLES